MIDFRPGIDLPKDVNGKSPNDISPTRNQACKLNGVWQIPQTSEVEKRLNRYDKAVRRNPQQTEKLIESWRKYIHALGEENRCTALAAIRHAYLRNPGKLRQAAVPEWTTQIDRLASENPELAKQIAEDTKWLSPAPSLLEKAAEEALKRFLHAEKTGNICDHCPYRQELSLISIPEALAIH